MVGEVLARAARVLLSPRRPGDRLPGERSRSHGAGWTTIFRRLYHNPDGYDRSDEFDFVTYFECEDEHVETFESLCTALRDMGNNPEWRFVNEGSLWRGSRVQGW